MTDNDAVEPSYLYATEAGLECSRTVSILKDSGFDIVEVRDTTWDDHCNALDVKHVSFRHPDTEPGRYYEATFHGNEGDWSVKFSPAEYNE